MLVKFLKDVYIITVVAVDQKMIEEVKGELCWSSGCGGGGPLVLKGALL